MHRFSCPYLQGQSTPKKYYQISSIRNIFSSILEKLIEEFIFFTDSDLY